MPAPATPKRPDGPAGHWLWGNLIERQRDPLGMLARGFARYGDIVRYRIGPFQAIQLAHPDAIKHVLVDHPTRYTKGRGFKRAEVLLGQGLLTAEGEHWRRQRRLAQPAFHRERLAALADAMARDTLDLLRRWDALPDGATVDVSAEMMQLTLSIVAHTLFSADVTGEAAALGQVITTVLHETNERLTRLNPLRFMLPTRANRDFSRALGVLNRTVLGIIEARRKEPHPPNDLLQMLLEARDEDTREAMDDRQLRDEVMTLFLAGHETTANTLAWTWHLLDKNPEAFEKLRAKADAVLGGRLPTAQDLPKLDYAKRVIEESMRLYPPAWIMGREASEDDEVLGYAIKKGDIVFASQWLTHRHPAFWEQPERFDPDRFTPERSAGRPKLAYFPFGAGQRMCLGNNFALMEAQLVLVLIAQHYRLVSATGQPPTAQPLITLRPGEVPMRLRRLGALA